MKNKLFFLIVLMCSLLSVAEAYADETLADKVEGVWYICYPGSSNMNEYTFAKDVFTDKYLVTNSTIDGNGEVVSFSTNFSYVAASSNIIEFINLGLDGSADHEYVIDVGQYGVEFVEDAMHLVYLGNVEKTIEWYLYPSAEQAIENSDTYQFTEEYLSTLPESEAAVIEENNQKNESGLRQSSIILLIASSICIIGLIIYIILKIIRVKKVAKNIN